MIARCCNISTKGKIYTFSLQPGWLRADALTLAFTSALQMSGD
jgi:hypothetical protein